MEESADAGPQGREACNRYLDIQTLGNQSPELRSIQPPNVRGGYLNEQFARLSVDQGKDILFTEPSSGVDECRDEPVADLTWHALVELRFGVVDSEVPVPLAFV